MTPLTPNTLPIVTSPPSSSTKPPQSSPESTTTTELLEESAIASYHARIVSHLAILTCRPTSHILLSIDHHWDKKDTHKGWCVVSALLLSEDSGPAGSSAHTLLIRHEARSERLPEAGGINTPGHVLKALKDVYKGLNRALAEKMRVVKKEEVPRFALEPSKKGGKKSFVDKGVGVEESEPRAREG